MKLDQILNLPGLENAIIVEQAELRTIDGDALCRLQLIPSHPDLPVAITAPTGERINIPNRDIPQLIQGLALMVHEDFF